jgi:hypothetical protein
VDFSFERQYRCLACDGETILTGKIRAHAHVSKEHRELLDSRHVDELLEQLPEQGQFTFEPEPELPMDEVFYCRYCDSFRLAENEIKGHCVSAHRDLLENPYSAKIDRDYWTRSEEPYLIQLDRAVKAIDSLDTVADFLTECDA